jgi:hypothetical protein
METYGEIDTAQLAALGTGQIIFYLIVLVFSIVCMWKIFTKAGEAGWKTLIPFYNYFIEFKIAWGNGWLFLLLLVPFVNIVIAIIYDVKLAKAFGKGGGFAVGLIFLPIIFLPILAFGSAQYIGPQ